MAAPTISFIIIIPPVNSDMDIAQGKHVRKCAFPGLYRLGGYEPVMAWSYAGMTITGSYCF